MLTQVDVMSDVEGPVSHPPWVKMIPRDDSVGIEYIFSPVQSVRYDGIFILNG